MGRKNVSSSSKTTAQVVSARAPTIKYTEASKLADKTSRTIAKLEQLVEVINSPSYLTGDPNRIIERYTEKLKRRINKRLTKLARWSDSSIEERQAEFRRFYPSTSYNAYRPNATVINTTAMSSSSSMQQRPVSVVSQSHQVVEGKPTTIQPTETASTVNGNAERSIAIVEKYVVTAINAGNKSSVSSESISATTTAEQNNTTLSNGTSNSPSKPAIKEEPDDFKVESDQIPSPQDSAVL